MSSAQSLREFIRERLTAAAAEIFSEFEQTIVRYEEEIDRQRRLLEISWKPQINLHRIELPLHYVRRDDEVHTGQRLWNQERTSSLDQEQPEPLQILEQKELCISQDEEQFVLKQETVSSLVSLADEDRDHHEPEADRHQLLFSLFPEAEIQNQEGRTHHFMSPKLPHHHMWGKEEVLTDHQERTASLDQTESEPPLIKEEHQELYILQHEGQFILKQENNTSMVTSSGQTDCCEPEPNRTQTLCQSFTEAENQDQDGCRNENLESNSNEELTQKKRRQQTRDHRDSVYSQKLKRHKRAHRDERSFSCKICGKSFGYKCNLAFHMRFHTGDRRFKCKTCDKCFFTSGDLTRHRRTHTGEKPFRCETCDKCFNRSGHLSRHRRTHTGEKPFRCETCDKCFTRNHTLTAHRKRHR